VVLHRKKPAAREVPDFEGLFRCLKTVAEREGFPAKDRGYSKNTVKYAFPKKSAKVCDHRCVPPLWPERPCFSDDFEAVHDGRDAPATCHSAVSSGHFPTMASRRAPPIPWQVRTFPPPFLFV
jgi:hypothetical protein